MARSTLEEAIVDSRFRRNLYGPFENTEDAGASMPTATDSHADLSGSKGTTSQGHGSI